MEEQDPELRQKIQAELPGILAWAVRGCVKWITDGQKLPEIPERFANEKSDYQESMDTIGCFLDECCETGADKRAGIDETYSEYKNWCQNNGCYPMKSLNFKAKLEERGYSQGRNNTQRY